MHEAITTSTTTKNYFTSSTDDLLTPVALANRSKSTEALGWSPAQDMTNSTNQVLENWPAFPPNMPSRTTPENISTKAESPGFSSDRPTQPNNKRWKFNGTGQLVDAEAANEWDLADEIVRLSIADVGADPGDDLRGTIHTPPQSKMAAAAVAQLSEASPLESSSDASADSPQTSDHQINISHSRGSSTDTTISSSQESALSAASHTLMAPSQTSLKVNTTAEVKERPHSFSGGLSAADLRRLQQAGEAPVTGLPGDTADYQGQVHQQWPSSHYRENNGSNERQFTPESQLTYPSLAHHSAAMPRHQHQQHFDYRSAPAGSAPAPPHREELQVDYHMQQRNFNQLTGLPVPGSSAPPPFATGRPTSNVTGLPYRQPPRAFPPQSLLASPTALGYTAGHHTSHLSLGNTQQIYDMMLPGPHENHHPAVARVQQQHNVFPRTHQHSASDPSALRDAATLALLNSNMQAFGPPGPGMFPSAMAPPPTMSLYASQFYPAQDPYSRTDVASAQAMAARLQSQYTGPYGVPGQGMGIDVARSGMSPDPSSPTGNGPSANNRKLGLYKTELCRSWEEKGSCRYASKCQFAHGEDELRKVARHPKYKTEICRTFWVSGSCPYGKRCCFIHTELPTSGVPPGSENMPPPPRPDGRERSMSTNSDPNDASVSLLARISAKRNQEASGSTNSNGVSTPVDSSPSNNGFQFNSRPPTGSLRVDTSTLDNSTSKQNKSAFPSFASNGLLQSAPEQSVKSPVPVTAGPDLGRHNNSRLEIVGYNQQRLNQTATNPNARHSFNGTEVDLNFTTPPPTVSFGTEGTPNGQSAPRASGHVRSGSAGNWGSFPRSSHLAASPYPLSSSPAAEVKMNSPWSSSELAVGSSRLNEKAWA